MSGSEPRIARVVWQRMSMRRHRLPPVVLVAALLAALVGACSGTTGSPVTSSSAPATAASTSTSTSLAPLTEALTCDPLDEAACLLPWPNDAFTVPDASTSTGRRLAIAADSTPANTAGVHIDPSDQDRADGFSPGSAVLALVPGLDVAATGIAPSTDVGASLAPDAPVVLLDTTSGQRLPYWGELDAQAPAGKQLLMVHPAVSLPEGHHIDIALRHLKDSSGASIAPSTGFAAAVGGTPEPPERAGNFRVIFTALAAAGISVDSLYLAWDFTVASSASLSGRALHIRSDAYASLGDGAPAFTVTSQTDNGNVRTIDGTYSVPNFLTGTGAPGSRFQLGSDGMPQRNATTPDYIAPFHCLVPLAGAHTEPTIVYGHGLLGSRGEVDALSFAAQASLAGACATDEIGMSSGDLPNLAAILGDLSHFPEQADRMQQGLLNQQFLGRLLNSPKGFTTSAAFQAADGTPLLDVGHTVFVGNSQGGILGGAASALSSEWSRVVLGVPGIDYSLLLPRSADWPEFQAVFDKAYTAPIDRQIALQLIQLLWDRGENDGYAQHLTAHPYDGITAKQVLLIEAFGDHQVSNVSTEVLARTIGAAVVQPALAPGRSNDATPFWGITAFDAGTPVTAALVMWDYGTPPPPAVNLAPTEPEYGRDPHGAGSREPKVLQQALTFLLTGQVTDVCAGAPCTSTVLSAGG